MNKNPDFVKLAEAMNVKALRLTDPADLPAKMKEFLEYDNTKPIVMECLIEQNEHVFPMVRPLFFFRGRSAHKSPYVGSRWKSPP